MKTLLLCLLPALALAQLGVPGGITPLEGLAMDAEPVVFAVQAVNNQLAQSNGGNAPLLKLQEIVKARTQVVSGQKLYLTLHLTGDYYCQVNVWYQSWNATGNRCKVVDGGPKCSNKSPAKRSVRVGGIAGGVTGGLSIDGNTDQSVVDALNFAACAMNDRSNAMMQSMVTDTSAVRYTRQVVRGMKYVFSNVPMAETLCRKSGACDSNLLSNCQVKVQNPMKQTCSFTVIWTAWETPAFQMTDFTCN